jgi:MYXO-CTERM domain-containing protein
MAVRIRPVPGWLALSSSAGSVAPGASAELIATATPAGLPSGTYRRRVTIASDDSDTPTHQVDVVLTVDNPNAPSAAGASLVVVRDTPAPVLLGGSDADGDPLTWAIIVEPQHGVLTGTAPALTYIPDAGYLGPDAFAFVASDGERSSAPAMILLDVQRSRLGPPVADPDDLILDEDTPGTLILTATDPDGDPVFWRIVVPPAHGTARVGGSELTVEPDGDWHGSDVVLVEPLDADSAGAAVAIAITVLPRPDAPVLEDLAATATAGLTAVLAPVAHDADGDALVLEIVTPPAHGNAVVDGLTIRYTAEAGYAGADALTVLARDPGSLTSEPATMAVTVTARPAPTQQPAAGGGGSGGCGAGAVGLLAIAGFGLMRRRRR